MFSNLENDADFIALWKSTSQFFAYYVILARKYSQFYNNPALLLEYLKQRGLYISDNETFENLTFMMRNYYDRIRQRGTIKVVKKKTIFDHDDSQSFSESDSNSEALEELNGELLQSIGFNNACDDFIMNFRKVEDCGWNMRNSSPLYRGTAKFENANKIWARLLTATDYLDYPLFGNVTSIRSEIDESDSTSDSASEHIGDYDYVFDFGSSGSGFGLDQASFPYSLAYILKYGINVNPNINYEFNFRIKAKSGGVIDPPPLTWFLDSNINVGESIEIIDRSTNVVIGVAVWNTDLATTLADLATSVNTHTIMGSPFLVAWGANTNNYTASYNAISGAFQIHVPVGSGATDNGKPVQIIGSTFNPGSMWFYNPSQVQTFSGGSGFGSPVFDIGANAFDCGGNSATLNNIITNTPSVYFVRSAVVLQGDLWYFFRGTIYSKNSFPIENVTTKVYQKGQIVRDLSLNGHRAKKQVPIGTSISNFTYFTPLTVAEQNKMTLTSWNEGNNLQMTSGVRKIIPFIKMTSETSDTYVGNVNFKPSSTNYSSGFINVSNWIDFWLKNNNPYYTYQDLKNIFRRYILPLDVDFDFNQLEETTQP